MEGRPVEDYTLEELMAVVDAAEARELELANLAPQYRAADWLGRLQLRRSNPDLTEYIESEDAQNSIVEARKSAIRNEGNHIII